MENNKTNVKKQLDARKKTNTTKQKTHKTTHTKQKLKK